MSVIKGQILDESEVLYYDAAGLPYYVGQAYRKTLTDPIQSRYADTDQVIKLSAKRAIPSRRGMPEGFETD